MSFGLVGIDILLLQEKVFLIFHFHLSDDIFNELLSYEALSLTLRFVHILHASYFTANLFYQSLYDSWRFWLNFDCELSLLCIYMLFVCLFVYVEKTIYFLLISVFMTFGAFGLTFTLTFFFFSFAALLVVSSLALWTGSLGVPVVRTE